MVIVLRHAADIFPETRKLYLELAEEILSVLPGVAVEEIGSTSIPGALTKGDVDILVEVLPDDLPGAYAQLEKLYESNEGMEGIPLFASFKGARNGLDFGIQLSGDRSSFDFPGFREALTADPDLVEQYNEIKRNAASQGDKNYRKQKNQFIEQVLSRRAVPRRTT